MAHHRFVKSAAHSSRPSRREFFATFRGRSISHWFCASRLRCLEQEARKTRVKWGEKEMTRFWRDLEELPHVHRDPVSGPSQPVTASGESAPRFTFISQPVAFPYMLVTPTTLIDGQEVRISDRGRVKEYPFTFQEDFSGTKCWLNITHDLVPNSLQKKNRFFRRHYIVTKAMLGKR